MPGVGFYGKIRIPTIGHKAAIDTAKKIASQNGAKLHIAVSGANNPLTNSQKISLAKSLFQHPVESNHKNVVDFLHNMSKIHDDFVLVCGSDRVQEYRNLLSRYNGNKDGSGKIVFSFRKWQVHEIPGKRTNSYKSPLRMSNDELTRTVSATKLEKLVKEGKYEEFHAYYPGMNKKETKRIFDQIKRGLALHEDCQPNMSLSMSRDLLPQIPKEKIKSFLNHIKKEEGANTETKSVDSKNLKASQGEFDIDKIFQIAMSKEKDVPIIVSKDNHVLDGHHRWVANHGKKILAHVVDLPILELIRTAKEYSASLKEETSKFDMDGIVDKFAQFCYSKVGLDDNARPIIVTGIEGTGKSFGGYYPGLKKIEVVTKNRHPVDVLRTLAHEIVHHKQNLDGRITDAAKEGETGSPIEDEANYMAGRILRWWAKAHPEHFSLGSLVENVAIFVVGGPCSGKDQYIRQLREETGFGEKDLASLLKKRTISGSVIINASADNYDDICEAKELLNSNGYHTSMLFVNTSNEISKIRNEQRKEKGQRVISEALRLSKFSLAQRNMERFTQLFEEDMKEIKNNINLKPEIPKNKKKQKPTEISDPNPSADGVGVGATFGGYSKVQKPFGLAESIVKWMENPNTQARFYKKYGNLAEKKLHETALKLNENIRNDRVVYNPKTISRIRESIDKGALDTSGTVPGAPISTGDALPERGKIFKRRTKNRK